jgi:hypothetical protein
MKCGKILGLLQVVCVGLVALMPVTAQAQNVRINKLANAAFGTISNFTIDQKLSQNICVYTTPLGTRYGVTASGSGSSGAFTIASGGNTMPYEVQWAATTGQTTGTSLTAKLQLGSQTTTATTSGCTSGPATTASLIIILRTATVGSARSGSYTGTLTLLVAPN